MKHDNNSENIEEKNCDIASNASGVNVIPKKTSRWAIYSLASATIPIVSMILLYMTTFSCPPSRTIEGSVVLVAIVFSHIAFLLGIIGIIVVNFNRKKLKGDWYALIAVFLSLPFVFGTVSAIFVNRNRAEQGKTLNGKIISEALIKYAKDHNGYLPDANQWCDLLVEYNEKLPKDRFYNPTKDRFKYDFSKEGICNYAFNRNLSSAKLDDISYNTVLVFESEGKWNLSGTEELFKKTLKKRQYVYVYTKDAKTEHDSPCAISIKDADYEWVLWKLPNTSE